MMIKVFTTFSGYDSQCLALERLKRDFHIFDYELVGYSEIDKFAIKAHDALFPQARNYGDITKIDWAQVPDFDLFTYSSPCFVAGTLVLTKEGYKPIETLKLYDSVLTHQNKYCEIVKIGKKLSKDIYEIKGMMFDKIVCTGNHPFYVRDMYRYGHKSKRMFSVPKWVEARNISKTTYLGYAINKESSLPKWDGSVDNRWGHGKQVNKLKDLIGKADFWYVMGRYLGDGWKKESKSGNGIIICYSDRNKETLLSALDRLNMNCYISAERTVNKATICMNELCDFVGRFGYYAYGKHIDGETISLPTELLKSFLDGMIDSDGCYTNNEYKITTVSKELAYGISQCVAKVYHRHSNLNYCKRNPKTEIEGRVVSQRDTYSVSWHTDIRKQDHAFYEDGYIWFPISSIEQIGETQMVYNIEVNEDHTYTANGAIVHNCQDFSQAGKQRGGEKGSGTRSSLLWECERAIRAKKPKFAVLENVSALVSGKFIDMFNLWQRTLEELGYRNYAKVLNAKDYGVPQNRERIFLVSIREDVDLHFYFPNPFKLEKRLVDVLEADVDEKYYISDTALNGYVEHNKRHVDKGTGFLFQPKDIEEDGGGIANTIRANGAVCPTDNHIIVKDE